MLGSVVAAEDPDFFSADPAKYRGTNEYRGTQPGDLKEVTWSQSLGRSHRHAEEETPFSSRCASLIKQAV